jgi:hypothetical protein
MSLHGNSKHVHLIENRRRKKNRSSLNTSNPYLIAQSNKISCVNGENQKTFFFSLWKNKVCWIERLDVLVDWYYSNLMTDCCLALFQEPLILVYRLISKQKRNRKASKLIFDEYKKRKFSPLDEEDLDLDDLLELFVARSMAKDYYSADYSSLYWY